MIPCKKALVLAPHPDDEVFGCGGAIMCHLEHGKVVEVIIVSDGAYGAKSEEDRKQYTLQRQEESQLAAKILGYGTPAFWPYPDRKVSYGEKLIQDILAAINQSQADLVYAPSIFEVHPDHRSIGMAVIEAARRIGKSLKLALYEVGMPMRPNCLLDISDFAERKMAAMQCFSSQNQKQRYDLDIAALNRYRTYTLPPEIESAEAYMIISAEELAKDPLKLYQSEYLRQKELGMAIDGDDVPLVSVIIRSMDQPTLTRALDSLALQTYPNIEIVLVNAKGGLHKQRSDWCGNFPLRLVNQDGNPLSRSQAANTGLTACRGEYLSFLDDDDALDPDHIFNLTEKLKSEAGSVIAYAGVRGETAHPDGSKTYIEFRTNKINFAKLLLGNVIPIHAILFPRKVLEQGVSFDEKLDLYEDWDFWLQLCRNIPFAFVDKMTATYYTGGSSDVSPLGNNPEKVKHATDALYSKWLNRLTPGEFKAVSDLYHQACNELQGVCGEIDRLQALRNQIQAELNQKSQQITRLQQELEIVYASRSWRITSLLRLSMDYFRRAKPMLRQTYYRIPLSLKLRLSIRKLFNFSIGLKGVKGQQSGGSLPKGSVGQVLIIERSVPRPNQDAGSMMIHNFMKVLIELGYGVTLYPADLQYDAAYTPQLTEMGIRCLYRPLIESLEHHLAAAGQHYNYVLTCRPEYTEVVIPIIRAYCAKAHLIYETHDLHFVRERRQAEIEQDHNLLAASHKRKIQELNIAAAVDCTLVVSEQERDILLQENPDLYVEVIPVISELFDNKARSEAREDLIFIGGYEHRPNIDAVVYFVNEILPLVLKVLPTVKFFVVGSKPPNEITSLASDHVVVLGFVPDISDLMNRVKISVNPLRYGAGVKGKVITSMAYGIPCVGSSIAVEGMALTDKKNVLIADTPQSFADAIVQLYHDKVLWERLSAQGHAFVSDNYSLKVAAGQFERIFKQLESKKFES